MDALTSVIRIAGGVAILFAVIVGSWMAVGFLAGLAIRAAQFAMG